jgi:hypothetical protein
VLRYPIWHEYSNRIPGENPFSIPVSDVKHFAVAVRFAVADAISVANAILVTDSNVIGYTEPKRQSLYSHCI